MLDKAIGDVAAATFVRDTIDGKPQSGDNGANIGINIAIMCNTEFSDPHEGGQ